MLHSVVLWVCEWQQRGARAAVHGEGPLVSVRLLGSSQAGLGGSRYVYERSRRGWSGYCLTCMAFLFPSCENLFMSLISALWVLNTALHPSLIHNSIMFPLFSTRNQCWTCLLEYSVLKKKSQVQSVKVFVCEHSMLLYLTTPTQQNSSKGFAWRRPFDPECHRSQLAKTSSLPLFISVPFNFPPTLALMLQLHFRWEFSNHLFLKAPAA